jgi:GNAT superfamily N-acetyltransferase
MPRRFTNFRLRPLHHCWRRIGAIRVVQREEGQARISPVFVLPDYQGRGFGQQVMSLVEGLHDVQVWELNSTQQETGTCYLYEKMGYVSTGEAKVINDRMTIISYEKIMPGQNTTASKEDSNSD